MRREAIPYEIIGGIKFYSRKEVKDLLAYLRLIVNPNDGISFDRIVNFPPRGIGKTTLEKIHKLSAEKQISYLETLNDLSVLNVGDKQKNSLAEFYDMICKYRLLYKDEDALNISQDIIADIKLQSYYEDQNTNEALERWNNVQELINSISDFLENKSQQTLSDFLEEVSLL